MELIYRSSGAELPQPLAAGVLLTVSEGARALYLGGSPGPNGDYVDTVFEMRDDLTGWDHREDLRLPRTLAYFTAVAYPL